MAIVHAFMQLDFRFLVLLFVLQRILSKLLRRIFFRMLSWVSGFPCFLVFRVRCCLWPSFCLVSRLSEYGKDATCLSTCLPSANCGKCSFAVLVPLYFCRRTGSQFSSAIWFWCCALLPHQALVIRVSICKILYHISCFFSWGNYLVDKSSVGARIASWQRMDTWWMMLIWGGILSQKFSDRVILSEANTMLQSEFICKYLY